MIGRVLGAWVHDLDPVAIHFPASWGLRGVHWYGLAYAAGFLAAAWLLGRWRRQGLAPARHAADESTLVTAVKTQALLAPTVPKRKMWCCKLHSNCVIASTPHKSRAVPCGLF